MIVELISTGSELLLGHIVNTNVKWLSEELNSRGYSVSYQTTVGDNPERMKEVFQRAGERADIVISSGGLGATQGDITRKSLADALGLPLVFHEEAGREVDSFYEKQGRVKPYESDRDRYLPEGAKVLHNPVGVAPAVVVEQDNTVYILLPGPPSELQGTFVESVSPFLEQRFGQQGIIYSERYAVYGYREMQLETLLQDLIQNQQNPTIALLIKPGYIEIRLTAKGESKVDCQEKLGPWRSILLERLKDIRSLDTSVLEDFHKLAVERGVTIGTAESCTGGLVGKTLTDLGGSSGYYQGGIISYANTVKEQVLGVSSDTLAVHGAVSEETATEMVEGVFRVLHTDYAIATTGIAGPGGGSQEKPVGLVYIGIGAPRGITVHKEIFIGDRDSIRKSVAERAIQYVYKELIER
ncbi:competence/damage-inducible protein A [Veillonella sp. CHU110]|uniref:competence/damage-inducible protein A n=1 Tax=Veillonella sp. CHU110 TaxID=2490947 RepID=UPI000F8D3DD1|nr:competence/damage-inducible protein A [Veillonella sp. CHU110]